jgi:mono/diheme cytochrome c family protein
VRAASLAAAVTLVLAGCGGGSSTPHHHVHLTAFERRGKALFIPTCGPCHELADAGTSGSAGPALTSPVPAARVRAAISTGGGVMSANLLTGQKAAAVAAYVAAATK